MYVYVVDQPASLKVGGGPVVERPVQPQHLFVGRLFRVFF